MVGADKVQGKCPPREIVYWGSPYHAGLSAWCATPGAARTAPRFVGIAKWIKAARSSGMMYAEGDQGASWSTEG